MSCEASVYKLKHERGWNEGKDSNGRSIATRRCLPKCFYLKNYFKGEAIDGRTDRELEERPITKKTIMKHINLRAFSVLLNESALNKYQKTPTNVLRIN